MTVYRKGVVCPMDVDVSVNLLRESLSLLMMISLSLLVVGLVIGVLLGLFQVVTQVQEAFLFFVFKLVGIVLIFWFCVLWMGDKILSFIYLVFD